MSMTFKNEDKKIEPDLRSELESLEVDLRTRLLVSEKLEKIDELLPGWTITLMPPEAKDIIEKQAAKRNVSPSHYISEAVGHVTGLHERGIWIGDILKRAITALFIEELQERAQPARKKKGQPNGTANRDVLLKRIRNQSPA